MFCEFNNFNVIIEAKKTDHSGQDEQQWKNEIASYLNEFPDNKKKLYFLAFGGSKTLTSKTIKVREQDIDIYFSSWQSLLNSVQKLAKKEANKHTKRLLSDIILAFEKHNFFCLDWLETLNKSDLSLECIKGIDSWKIRDTNLLDDFYSKNKLNLNNNSINIISLWQTH